MAYMLVLPSVLLIALLLWYPLLRVIQASFFQWDGISPLTRYVGLANYQHLFFGDEISTARCATR